MIIIKNKIAVEKMKVAGALLAQVLSDVAEYVIPGKTTLEINDIIERKMIASDLHPVCKGYGGYSWATCISLNDVVVHGVPSAKVVLKSGDFVKIDVAGSYKKYCADMARYFFVGEVSPQIKKIAAVAQRALDGAIDIIVPGKRISDVSAVIQKEVERHGFGVVRKFAGHGIGKDLHEDPEIPNFNDPDAVLGPILREGMTLAIEPMITERSYEIRVMSDGWTAKTLDGGIAAHVEDTVLVTHDGAEVLTRLKL
jgi:methionyl aminopeptidase